MKIIFEIALVCAFMHLIRTEEIRLLDLDPPEAQQYIDRQDTSLKYAPKIESNVPAVRFLGNEPHNVNEDIYLANQYHGQDGLGGYLYGYAVPDIAKTERKQAGGDLRGAYNYIAGNGQEIKVEYWDDGNGFHQIDNVPKVLPQQIDDTPEVKAAKEEHARIWQEQAERNSKPIQNPYDSHANYAPPGQAQNQLINQYQQQKQQFPNPGQNVHYQGSQNPAGFGGQYQASQSKSQYANAPGASGHFGINGGQLPGSHQASGSSQYGVSQATGSPIGSSLGSPGGSSQYGGGQASGSQTGSGLSSGGAQFGSSQAAGVVGGSSQYGGQKAPGSGQYGGQQASGSSQYSAGQASGSQTGSGLSSGSAQFGSSQSAGVVRGSSQYGGQKAPGNGQYGGQQASGSSQYGVSQAPGSQYGGSGQYGNQQASGSHPGITGGQYGSQGGKNEGEYSEQDNQEEQGPPKGFFYSFDYPVGIIVSKGGPADLKDLYNKNKNNFEKQLQQGHLEGSRSSTGYLAA